MTPAKKKVPTKTELLQLQKLYKTDEKIGERLGGVPAYLIAYWRRKKNVPKHSQPKFSEKEIVTLWERFGDDDKCGLELGISKAAFYNWRRRYGIREKPAFLKLEQLEFSFPGMKASGVGVSLYGKQTIFQKIISKATGRDNVAVGETVTVEPDLTIVSGNPSSVIEKFRNSGSDIVWNPNKIIIALESSQDGTSFPDAENQKLAREFARRQGIKNFFEPFEGHSLQAAIDRGLVLPGSLALGNLPYVTGCGTLASLGVRQSEAALAEIWSKAESSITVPESLRVDITGRRMRGAHAVDIAFGVIKLLKVVVNGKAVEFYGNVTSLMSVSERLTLTSLTSQGNITAAVCAFDSGTRRYMNLRATSQYQPVVADKNAEYENGYLLNVEHLPPQVAKGNNFNDIRAVTEYEGLHVSCVFIGYGSTARFDELRQAAEILKGRDISGECRLFVQPATREIYLEALKKGFIRVLIQAGAIVLHPGQGFSTLMPDILLVAGERALITSSIGGSSANTLLPADTYHCSPATAAASAINGAITDPARYVK